MRSSWAVSVSDNLSSLQGKHFLHLAKWYSKSQAFGVIYYHILFVRIYGGDSYSSFFPPAKEGQI